MKTLGKKNYDKVGDKTFHADQDNTASYCDSGGRDPDPTNAKGGGPRRRTSSGRGTRAQRNERFGEEVG